MLRKTLNETCLIRSNNIMSQSFVITLREGLEAFLIIAISLAYLRKTGRERLVPAVHWGIAIAVAASIGAGILLQRASNQALWEGVLALVAAVLVGTLIVHMWRTGRKMKANIEGRLESSAMRAGRAAFLGVLGFTVLMIAREGMETALLMNTLLFQVPDKSVLIGARRRDRGRGRGGLAVVTLRPAREPVAVLPGHGDLPVRVRASAACSGDSMSSPKRTSAFRTPMRCTGRPSRTVRTASTVSTSPISW